jgi:hypothetical protein
VHVCARSKDQAEDSRREARAAARSEQERQFAELRASVERSHQEHARQIQRLEDGRDRLQETVEELSAERDMFQRLLFTAANEDPSGGDAGVEARGAQGSAGRR